jgi:hypothetical protein
MWEPRHLITLWAFTACYSDSFDFFIYSPLPTRFLSTADYKYPQWHSEPVYSFQFTISRSDHPNKELCCLQRSIVPYSFWRERAWGPNRKGRRKRSLQLRRIFLCKILNFMFKLFLNILILTSYIRERTRQKKSPFMSIMSDHRPRNLRFRRRPWSRQLRFCRPLTFPGRNPRGWNETTVVIIVAQIELNRWYWWIFRFRNNNSYQTATCWRKPFLLYLLLQLLWSESLVPDSLKCGVSRNHMLLLLWFSKYI